MRIAATYRTSDRRRVHIAAYWRGLCLMVCGLLAVAAPRLRAQDFLNVQDSPVPEEVERIYQRGIAYLVAHQNESGSWDDAGGQTGVTGLAVLAMLAHGDDPNVGPTATAIKRGIGSILKNRNVDTGYIGNSMYNHGFAALALAEAYGVVDDSRIGPALKKATELSLASQAQNPLGAWRYNPESADADTTVSGAVLVSLFAARNAGVDVPDAAFEKAFKFYKACQGDDGGFGYTGPSGANAPRNAIGCLVLSLAKKKDSRMYEKAFVSLRTNRDDENSYHEFYFLYYGAQAYFHGSYDLWRAWNATNIKTLATTQNADGSWTGNQGITFSTAAALLSLAVNYRFLPIYER